MKSILTEILVLSLLIALPVLAADVGLHQGSAQLTRAAAPPQAPAIVMLAQINQSQQSATKAGRATGICKLVENDENMNAADISAVWSAIAYFQEYENRNDFTDEDVKSAKYTILQQPNHGTLVEDTVKPALNGNYIYMPKAGYEGKDSAEILVEIKGMKVKVSYFFHVLGYPIVNHWDEMCDKNGGQWKISTTLDANDNSKRGLVACVGLNL